MFTMQELREVVHIGIDLTNEKDKNRLLEKMLIKVMDLAKCDAGTLYLYKDNALHFKIMKTLSQNVSRGENGEEIDLPPVPLKEANVCAFAAIHRELINIEDVYHSDRFDFSGPKRYDGMTGYRTGSMLVVPLEDAEGVLVGVLQLINKLDEAGQFIPFTEEDEFAIRSLGSMSAVSLSGMIYLEEIKAMLHSFVQAFATAVDERTPYNGAHTRKVTTYTGILADYMNTLHEKGEIEDYFDDNRREQLVLAAALHDIGKMIVPLEVMNKETRLSHRLNDVMHRFELMEVLYERDYLKGVIDESTYQAKIAELKEDCQFIQECNTVGFMSDDKLERINAIGQKAYQDDTRCLPYLNEEEVKALSIRKGTLSTEERQIMESHASYTRTILEKVHFNDRYKNITFFASSHHEALNGSGYPDHLSDEQLPLETRMLAVTDIYDALTSTDRPYKKPIPKPKAFAILRSMVEEGKLEGRLVDYLEAALENVTIEDIHQMSFN